MLCRTSVRGAPKGEVRYHERTEDPITASKTMIVAIPKRAKKTKVSLPNDSFKYGLIEKILARKRIIGTEK
jgi:hypothetical protein